MAAIVGNPAARVNMPGLLSRAKSDAFIDRQIETISAIGCGFSAVERKADGAVVGDAGLRPVPEHLPFASEGRFEIGWQLSPQYFGKGYASETARG